MTVLLLCCFGKGKLRFRFGFAVREVRIRLVFCLFIYYFSFFFFFCGAEGNGFNVDDEDDFLANVTRTETYKVLKFGKGSVVHGRDSRYWDRDDRRRDEDYDEDAVEHSRVDDRDEASDASTKVKSFDKKSADVGSRKGSEGKGVGLYNEAGRDELKMYEAEYEASLKNARSKEDDQQNQQLDDEHLEKPNDIVDIFDEYDDGIDYHDAHGDDYDDTGHDKGEDLDMENPRYEVNVSQKVESVSVKPHEEESSEHSQNLDEAGKKSKDVSAANSHSLKKSRPDSKRKGKRRKFSGNALFFLGYIHMLHSFYSLAFHRDYEINLTAELVAHNLSYQFVFFPRFHLFIEP